MDWIESIKEIREAQDNNRLVIFVGSGVSKNSNIPTWQELIQAIADKIHYQRETSMISDQKIIGVSEEHTECVFTQEELLRIPEYFYQSDTSKDHEVYYQFICDTLHCDSGPNQIDDEIFNIMPHHIITTNFDSLLEDSSAINSRFYTVVSKDSDLLSHAEERYIIKMHGDLMEPHTLVLKENDYIVYEQEHPLISTFIRALLVNHIFLFLGYSLNDYNLNLIIGWINYFCKILDISARPKNFLITINGSSEFERLRFEDKNIYVVNLASMPDEFAEKNANHTSLESLAGKKLYSFLRCITDTKILQQIMSLEDILIDRYKLLKSYNVISLKDMEQLYSFGRNDYIGTTLSITEQEMYDQLVSLLKSSDGSQELREVFGRTILTNIEYPLGRKNYELESKIVDKYFRLYLDNDYVGLENQLNSCPDTATKIYYYHFIGKGFSEIKPILDQEETQTLTEDFIAILLHKMRDRLAAISFADWPTKKTEELKLLFDTAPVKYRPAIGHLKMMFNSDAEDKHKMSKIVDRQEEKYSFRNTTYYSEHDYKCIWDIQSYAYNYYFFVKGNGLPVDYFTDLQDYLYYYIKVILCSYAPTSFAEKDNGFFFPTQPLEHYPINEIDFDIIIKYIKPTNLKELLEKYTVSMLEIAEDVDFCLKYKNLCCAYPKYPLRKWTDHIFNFNIILCFLDLENDTKKELFANFVNMLKQMAKTKPVEITHLFEALYYFVMHFSIADAELMQRDLLNVLIDEAVYTEVLQRYHNKYIRLLKNLSSYATKEIQQSLEDSLKVITDDKRKVQLIVMFRYLLPAERYADFITQNIELLDMESIFSLLIEGRIEYTDDIFQIYVLRLENEVHKRNNNPGLRTYPDCLTLALEYCIILKLFGFNVDLELLKPYEEYSMQLQFMLDPEQFDYSLVDTADYMWQNLIINSEYLGYFVQHKEELLSEDLKEIFNRNVDTREQQKIVYGMLLNDEELWEF